MDDPGSTSAPAGEIIRLRSEDVHWREVEGEVVALDTRSSRYLSANRTATLLWPLLAEGTTREQLISRLAEATGIDRVRAGADIEAFLKPLRESGLLSSGP